MKLGNLSALAALTALISPMPAPAESINAVPIGWRIENYVGEHKVMLWHTGAPNCINGGIHTTGMDQDDHNRLWSLILTAKSTRKKVGIFYSSNAGTCVIQTFYMDE